MASLVDMPVSRPVKETGSTGSSPLSNENGAPHRPPRRLRWPRLTRARWLWLGGIVLLVLFHPQLLQGAYLFLVVQDPPQKAQYAVVLNGDSGSFDLAAQLWQNRLASTILVVDRSPNRLVQLGISPPLSAVVREEMLARGVPDTALEVLATQARTNWEAIRALDHYLQESAATADAILICPDIQTRYYRAVVRETVGGTRDERYRLTGFAAGGITATNWWRNRLAITKVATGYLRLAYVTLHGEGVVHDKPWDVDECERWMRTLRGSDSP